MQGHLDNEEQQAENAVMTLSAMTVLGDRPDQQDSFGFHMYQQEGLAVICDGMGGLQNGRLASETAVGTLLDRYAKSGAAEAPIPFLQECADRANEAVREKTAGSGSAGTTLVSVLIRPGQLYWLSVGDSRGYLYRSGALVQFTQDHNYRTVLREQKAAGCIDETEFLRQSSQGEALVSYLGLEHFKLRDCSAAPLPLQSGDRVLLMSDGLYKLASDEELLRILDNFTDIGEALQALEIRARKNAHRTGVLRDNMTVILIEIK